MSSIAAHPRLRLQPGAHKRLKAGYPWVYSNEVVMDAATKALPPGTVVTVQDASGPALATAHFNPRTLIAARVLDHAPDIAIDVAFIAARLKNALTLRDRLFPRPFYRLVHAEADGLPGLVIDRFGDVCVIQPNTAAWDRARAHIAAALTQVIAPKIIVLRGDSAARTLEGLADETVCLAGEITGPVPVEENGVTFFADLVSGQKTGWFFDQRDNRAFMASLSKGRTVLDLFAHTGGFGLVCAKAGATAVTMVDSSRPALDLAVKAAAHNDLAGRCTAEKSDVFAFLEAAAAKQKKWDVVIADPPAYVKSRKDLKPGLQGYRKLARLAAAVTAPGGALLVASCSHNAPLDEFAAAVARGVFDAHRTGRILRTAGAAADHPVHPLLPESAYLKAQVLQLD